MDQLLYAPIPVLDHGWVRLVDKMGDDSAIVQAARTSTGNGTKTPAEDASLINYLYKNKHSSPFEMTVMKFHVKTPIFIARQWERHRAASFTPNQFASINELSLRYSEAKDEFYIPALGNIRGGGGISKQSSGYALHLAAQETARLLIETASRTAMANYRELRALGVSKEQARMVLPFNLYTEFYWKIDLHNLFHLLSLRLDAHAQSEFQEYAQALASIVKQVCPVAWAAFETHTLKVGKA